MTCTYLCDEAIPVLVESDHDIVGRQPLGQKGELVAFHHCLYLIQCDCTAAVGVEFSVMMVGLENRVCMSQRMVECVGERSRAAEYSVTQCVKMTLSQHFRARGR